MNAVPMRYEMIRTRNLTFEVATAGQGDKLALLLHGFPETAHSYRHQIPLLVRLGYRVWAPNLRGYGKTDRPRGRRAYTIDRLEGDVTDLIEASGARSVLLVGHDWGGVVAYSYAMYGARPLERLAILNAPHPARFVQQLRDPAQLRRSWYMFAFQLPWLPELLARAAGDRILEGVLRGWAVHPERFTDADLAVYLDNLRQPGAPTAMFNYYRGMLISLALLRRRAPRRITVPTLLLWGERDRALGSELALGVERYVDDLTRKFIPDASHWVQQDAPEQVNALLEAWLTQPRG